MPKVTNHLKYHSCCLSRAPYWGTWPTTHPRALTGDSGLQAGTHSTELHPPGHKVEILNFVTALKY